MPGSCAFKPNVFGLQKKADHKCDMDLVNVQVWHLRIDYMALMYDLNIPFIK